MLNKIIFYTVIAITGTLTTEINTGECQKCLSLSSQLTISLQEQVILINNNLEFARVNERLCKESEKRIDMIKNRTTSYFLSC